MLAPFLQLLFGIEKLVEAKPAVGLNASAILANLKYLISGLIKEHSAVYALGFICILVLVAIFFKNLFAYLALRTMSPLRNGVMTRLRADLYDKLLKLPIGYFTEQRKGDIISRMSNDANEIEWSVLSTLEGLINQPLQIIVILVTLVMLSPMLSLFLLVLLPVTGFVIGRVSRSLKKQSAESQQLQGTMMSLLDETLGGIRIIKAFNAEEIFRHKFFTVNSGLNDVRNKMNFRKDMASPLSEIMGVAVLCCILWFGGQLVLGKSAGLGSESFITYILFFTQIINPSKSLSSAFYSARRGTAAIERIEEILQEPVVLEDNPNAIHLEGFKESIELRNVTFSYGDTVILNNINLIVPKGKTVALVGSSGAGKSTLADLVPRFHDVTSGELLIDGINIKDYSIESVRSQISVVTQEAILFNDTVANNIALGITCATNQQIEEAAQAANAYNFIAQKEEGFDTNIGDRGSKLSGGERQRVTIARALLKNPPILILDEATSALDTESERLVQDAIYTLMKSRTSIVIAHRLSTIRHADEIVVMQKGEIIERGKHDELITKNGLYKRLVDMQKVK
ncbi:unnamed protein product [Rotaria socialis]|uniref:Uncharacterized protein n=1 Tax=Rotaria socialis TaxID=392032 RepID=A0A821N8R6_9BILA|nr:unnamed protein product [Rotaria socialis]CAF4780331.1 unnamed protein product [Rotaria socialis]